MRYLERAPVHYSYVSPLITSALAASPRSPSVSHSIRPAQEAVVSPSFSSPSSVGQGGITLESEAPPLSGSTGAHFSQRHPHRVANNAGLELFPHHCLLLPNEALLCFSQLGFIFIYLFFTVTSVSFFK